MRRAARESIRRGDRIDLKQFGFEREPARQSRASPAPSAECPATAPPVTASDLDGKQVRPLEAGEARASVLFFLTPDCPISNSYAPEINALVKENAVRPLRFYAVYVDPYLTAPSARKHATAFGYRCPVLLDPRHRLVAATGVTTPPEVAVVTADGRVAYRGRIDDRYPRIGVHRQAPTRRDLRAALASVLADRPVATPRTTAVGCAIPELP
jgi:hypothetical protein